jgi:hypothetical protein
MTAVARLVALPVVAVALVAGVLGVQVSHGGGEFEPLKPADPCAVREVSSEAEGIENLTERLVLLGLDGAACRLGVSREALTLELAQQAEPTDEQVDALREGLHVAVQRMKKDGTLPKISSFVDEAMENADLNRFLEAAIKALPDSLIDKALDTEDVLDRAIDDLDLREILANLDDESELNAQLNPVIEKAVKDSLVDRLKNLI